MNDTECNLWEECKKLRKELKTCVNELCLQCGAYRNQHHGYCDSCRWLKVKNDLAEQMAKDRGGQA